MCWQLVLESWWMSTGHHMHMHMHACTVQALINSACISFTQTALGFRVNDKVALHLPLNATTN